MSPRALPSGAGWALGGGGLVFQLVVISIYTRHIAQSPQSSPRGCPAFKMEHTLFPPSLQLQLLDIICQLSTKIFKDKPKEREDKI